MTEHLADSPSTNQTKAAESRHQHELHALIDLTAALGASTDIDISLRVLLERMVSSFGAAGGECRLLATPDESNLLAQHGLDPGDEATALRRLTTQVMTIQEEERARIARELHDEAGQALTALKIELSLLAHELPADAPALQQRMRETLSQVNELLAAMRRMAHEMHPPALETLGLSATLEGYAERTPAAAVRTK